jgi:hypothetical protein
MNRVYISGAGVVAALLAFFIIRNVTLSTQESLIGSLLTVSSILFGILGVWVSILDPTAILGRTTSEQISAKGRLAIDLMPSLRQSVYILAIIIVLRFAVPILSEFSTTKTEVYYQGGVGFVLTILYLWQAGILLETLRVPERVTTASANADARSRSRAEKNRRSNKTKSEV